jgi:hypothetical protein
MNDVNEHPRTLHKTTVEARRRTAVPASFLSIFLNPVDLLSPGRPFEHSLTSESGRLSTPAFGPILPRKSPGALHRGQMRIRPRYDFFLKMTPVC